MASKGYIYNKLFTYVSNNEEKAMNLRVDKGVGGREEGIEMLWICCEYNTYVYNTILMFIMKRNWICKAFVEYNKCYCY